MRHGVGLECASAAKAERALKIGSSCLSPEFEYPNLCNTIRKNNKMQHVTTPSATKLSTFPPEVADTGEASVPK